MRTSTIAVALLAFVASASSTHAQSTNALAGWIGLISTPVGGLPPTVAMPREGSAPAFGVRALYGHWQYGPNDDNTTNLGIGVVIPGSKGSVTLELGHTSKKGCSDCGAILGGIEAHLPLKTASVSGSSESRGPVYGVAVEPAIGYMTETSSQVDFSAFSFSVRFPLSVSIPSGSNTRVIPFVSPGAGLGVVNGSGNSESGMRVMLGGGAALATGPVQVTLAANKIFINGGATLLGVALSYGV